VVSFTRFSHYKQRFSPISKMSCYFMGAAKVSS
jgi:hypothetical protein